jgi:hypothetical protein
MPLVLVRAGSAMAEQTPGASRFEPLSALWRVFAAPQTLLILMGLLALFLALGTLIPQIPAQATGDPQAWLSLQPGFLGQGNRLIQTLDLFDIFHSFGFRFLLVLTGLCLFVRIVEAGELAWRATVRSRWTAEALGFWGRRPPQVRAWSYLPLDEAGKRLDRLLADRGYWLTEVPHQPASNLVAGRRSAMLWVLPFGYGALLLALLGLAIVGTWGWRSESWQQIPGESRAIGYDTPYTIRLDHFRMELGEDQRLNRTIAGITWLEAETELGQDFIGTGQPAKRGGVTIRQVGYVPVVRMRGWDEQGQPLMLETGEDVLSVAGAAEIQFSSPQDQPVVLASDHDLFLALTFEPLCEAGRPALHVDRIHREGNERRPLGVLYESGSVLVEGFRLDVELFFVPILRADSLSALWLVVAGMVLVVIALATGWLLPPRLVWIAVSQEEEDKTLVQVLALPGAGMYRWLPPLVERLQGVLRDDA